MKYVVEPETPGLFFDDEDDDDHTNIRNRIEKLLIKMGFYRFTHWVSDLPGKINR
jgi:hypothetical protein